MTVHVYPKNGGKGRGFAPNQQQVVAAAPKVYWNSQTPGTADASERGIERTATAALSASKTPVWFGGMDPATRALYLKNNPQFVSQAPAAQVAPVAPFRPARVGGVGGGGVGGSGSGGTAGNNDAYKNAADTRDFEYRKGLDEASAASKDAEMRALEQYYLGGGYKQGSDDLIAQLEAMGDTQTGDVNAAYDRSITNLDDAYGTAGGVAKTGFDALSKYLGDNPNNAYAGFQAAAPTAGNPMQDYLNRYGVGDSGGDVAAQVALEQSQSQAGADNYNNLAALLSGNAQQGDRSRLAEMKMAQQLSGLNLGSDLAGFKSGSANARAGALAQIANNTAAGKFQQQQSQNSITESLIQKILAAGGSLTGTPAKAATVAPEATEPEATETAPVAAPVAPVATAKVTKGAKAMGKTAGPGKHWEKSPKGKWVAVANKKGGEK